MTSARLLTAVLLLIPLSSFAQEKQQPVAKAEPSSTSASTAPAVSSSPALTEEQISEWSRQAVDRLDAQRSQIPTLKEFRVEVSPDGRKLAWDADDTCYAIRSYVVARDEKDSDSTHLVRSSTCVPASQYSVKSALAQQDSDHK